MKAQKAIKATLKYGSVLLLSAFLVFIISLTIFNNVTNEPKPVTQTPQIQQPPVTTLEFQDPDLLQKASVLGIDVSNVNLRYGEPSTATRLAEYAVTEIGDTIKYEIIVRPGASLSDTYGSLAHEYYHYYWDTHEDFKNVAPLVRTLYMSYEPLKKRMQVYIDRGMTTDSLQFANELIAITCTEVTPEVISNEINSYCRSGVPNRGVIQAKY